jgi:hypothetical protein
VVASLEASVMGSRRSRAAVRRKGRPFILSDVASLEVDESGALVFWNEDAEKHTATAVDKAGLMLWLAVNLDEHDAARTASNVAAKVSVGDVVTGLAKLWRKAGE